ncbi:beta-hexosaminidase 3 [Olea europaea subsp. europaea]|uniref:beta-N-acetylhexosaminidase n=1 Tax=Olea europaea subsp. europaea TaxID=158383 RepID=A0A8S0UH35_OLEEU|nr:beta-hexosaminidase 3 [Olea europaea subsp. europaea]
MSLSPNITDPKQQSFVLRGEVCMWGEHIDGSDIEQTTWPRAAAAAAKVAGRLAHFRCLLNIRGVAAAPLAGPGRAAPEELVRVICNSV